MEKRKKILIVDDNKSLAEMLVDILGMSNFETTALTDSTDVMGYLKSYRPDVILLDIMMPGMDGISLCRMIKTTPEYKDVKVIMLSFKDFVEDREKAKDVGADAFINKGTSPNEIVRMINEVTSGELYLKFWGTRGSVPSPDLEMMKYGGDTACVELTAGKRSLILDAGTGIRKLGDAIIKERKGSLSLHLLLTHFHLDHIQGFPFFTPVYHENFKISVFGCQEAGLEVQNVLETQMGFPYFPIPMKHIASNLSFTSLSEGSFSIDDIAVQSMYLNHPGNALGFRIAWNGKTIVYIPDNELSAEMADVKMEFGKKLVDFCRQADVLIHDAQFTPEEYRFKKSWGHSSYEDALQLAMLAGVKRFYLFHHDPSRTDTQLNGILDRCKEKMGQSSGLFCDAARQGDKIII